MFYGVRAGRAGMGSMPLAEAVTLPSSPGTAGAEKAGRRTASPAPCGPCPGGAVPSPVREQKAGAGLPRSARLSGAWVRAAVAASTCAVCASVVLAAAWEWGGAAVPRWRWVTVVLLAAVGPPLLQVVYFSRARGVTPYLPFQGGAPFVIVQCIAWTFYTAALLIAFGYAHKGFHGELPPPHMLKGIGCCALGSLLLVALSLLIFKEGEAGGPEHEQWTTLCVFAVLLAAIPFGTHAFNDIFHLRLVFSDRQVTVVSAVCLASAAPLIHVVGHKRHAPSLYHLFQPFEGGDTFVKLQMVGWTCYTVVLVLAFGPLLDCLSTKEPPRDALTLPSQLNWCGQICILVSLWHFGRCRARSAVAAAVAAVASSPVSACTSDDEQSSSERGDRSPAGEGRDDECAAGEEEVGRPLVQRVFVSILLLCFPVAHLACWLVLAITMGLQAAPIYALFFIMYLLSYWDRLGIGGWDALLRALTRCFTSGPSPGQGAARGEAGWGPSGGPMHGATMGVIALCAAQLAATPWGPLAGSLSSRIIAGAVVCVLTASVGYHALRGQRPSRRAAPPDGWPLPARSRSVAWTRTTPGCGGRSLLLARGSVLDGRYHCVAELGRGAVAAVWLCWDARSAERSGVCRGGPPLPEFVAVKVSRACAAARGALRHEAALLRFTAERGCSGGLLDAFTAHGASGRHRALVLPLLGESLRAAVAMTKRRRAAQCEWCEEETVALRRTLCSVLRGLAELHEAGVAQLDLKPDNVLQQALPESTRRAIDEWPLRQSRSAPGAAAASGADGAGWRVIDLSHAQLLLPPTHPAVRGSHSELKALRHRLRVMTEGEAENPRGGPLQARPYRAPEALLGGAVSFRTDVWSLGCVAYELATGERLLGAGAEGADEESEVAQEAHVAELARLLGPPPPLEQLHELRVLARGAPAARALLRMSAAPPPRRDLAAELRGVLPAEHAEGLAAFIARCLWGGGDQPCAAWDPARRPTPKELLCCPWLSPEPLQQM